MASEWLLIVAIVGIWIAVYSRDKSLRLKRSEFIRTYRWPPGLLYKLRAKHPGLTPADAAAVARGLQQFFATHLMSGRKFVAMPSQAVDELWHEFILYTRDYEQFCKRAFGRFMHHTPAAAMGPYAARRTADGLRRAWWFAWKDEDINPKHATRLPLLFALDGDLQIPNGFRYDLNCDALEKNGVTNVHCINELVEVPDVPDTCGD
jgi:hypothetical protein